MEGSSSSDEDISIRTVKDIKQRLGILDNKKKMRRTRSTVSSGSISEEIEEDHDHSVIIIRTHSTPNITDPRGLYSQWAGAHTKNDSTINFSPNAGANCKASDSFCQMKLVVADINVTPTSSHDEEPQLNNTLDVVNYILNNGPPIRVPVETTIKSVDEEHTQLINLDDESTNLGFKIEQTQEISLSATNFPDASFLETEEMLAGITLSDLESKHYDYDFQTKSIKEESNASAVSIKQELQDIPKYCYAPTILENWKGFQKVNSTSFPEIKSEVKIKTPFKNSEIPVSSKKLLTPSRKNTLQHIVEHTIKDIPKIQITDFHNLQRAPEKQILQNVENVPGDFYTPTLMNPESKQDIYPSPSATGMIIKTPVFKKPKIPVSNKKLKSPSHGKAFHHIVSPVASYIKNSPVVPLIKDVIPKKPLREPSSSSKPVKQNSPHKNKENLQLPKVAYKSAVNTHVINSPGVKKLPESPWAKKVASANPRVVVMRHDQREVYIDAAKERLSDTLENSITDVTLHQADLSVCTQKSAYK